MHAVVIHSIVAAVTLTLGYGLRNPLLLGLGLANFLAAIAVLL